MIAAEVRCGRFSVSKDFLSFDLGNSVSSVHSVDFAPFGPNPVSSTMSTGTESLLRGSIWALGRWPVATPWPTVSGAMWQRRWEICGSCSRRAWKYDCRPEVAGARRDQSFACSGHLSRSTASFDGILGLRGRFELGSGFRLPDAFGRCWRRKLAPHMAGVRWRRAPEWADGRDSWLPPPPLRAG
jgi:hypothetical protein